MLYNNIFLLHNFLTYKSFDLTLIFRESSDENEEIAEAMAEIDKFEETLKQREAIKTEQFQS